MDNRKWVWIDLELTGLNINKDTIVEIAVVLSDTQGQNLVYGPNITIHVDDSTLEAMDPFVINMHQTSGLYENIKASQTTLRQAEDQVLTFLQDNNIENGIIAGNTVHMDRLFLIKDMPRLFEGYLHSYKILDVTAFKEVARVWYPSLNPHTKVAPHRAFEDILGSIDEFLYYKQHIVKESI